MRRGKTRTLGRMGKRATLFVASNTIGTLEAVARRVFEVLGIEQWEERFSSNYPNEHYFAGYTEDVQLTVYDADSDVMPEYRFLLDLDTATWRKGRGKIDADPSRVAQALAKTGFTIFIPEGDWYKVGWDGKGDRYAA